MTDYVRNHTSLKNPLRVVCIRDTENEDGFTVKEQSGDNIAMSSAFRETCILTQTSDDEFVTYLCKVLSIAPGAAEECTPKENIVVKEKEGVLLKQESSKSDRQQKQPTLDDYAEGQQ
ncbi:hypothetical protein SOPP22_19170 [Shewanella sp. OPT22]|nr:hypothetical protein SOPP22_19170 [Shewanella sp. OPT22]